jgi:hypothetical protein
VVIAGTTFVKFAVMAIGLSAFWGGFWAGVNYAASFVLIHLMHWTVATKQPAMTAPAMAHKLKNLDQQQAWTPSSTKWRTCCARRWPASSATWRWWCRWCWACSCWPG